MVGPERARGRMGVVVPLAAVLLLACGSSVRGPRPEPLPVEVAPASAPAARSTALPPAATEACPVAPLALVALGQDPPLVLFRLGADGSLWSGVSAAQPRPLGQLDPRGCVHDEDTVLVEGVGDELWTLRRTIPASGDSVGPLRIDDDGAVRREGEAPTMRIEGYHPAHRCAAKLLLGTMLAAFGGASMAVVDGVAPELPPPVDSVCPTRRH